MYGAGEFRSDGLFADGCEGTGMKNKKLLPSRRQADELLKEFLLAHESDIRTETDDFGDLWKVFQFHIRHHA